MVKTPISWIGLIKIKSDELKKAGDAGGLKKAIKESKSVWQEIKAGSHPMYEKGKGTRKVGKKEKKGKKSKTEKRGKNTMSSSAGNVDTKDLLENCKVCSKCLKKIEKYLKKQGNSEE